MKYNVKAIRTDIHGGVLYLTILDEVSEEMGIKPGQAKGFIEHDPVKFPYKNSDTIKLWEIRCDLVDRGYEELVKEADKRFLEQDPLHDPEKILKRIKVKEIRDLLREKFDGEKRVDKAWGFLEWYNNYDFPKDAI